MADLATQNISRAGIVPSFSAAAGGGDKFIPDEDTYIEAINGSGGAITVTIATPKTVDGEAIADRAVSVAAGARRKIGPFPKSLFADPADSGKAAITYSGVTSLTIGVFKLGEGS